MNRRSAKNPTNLFLKIAFPKSKNMKTKDARVSEDNRLYATSKRRPLYSRTPVKKLNIK